MYKLRLSQNWLVVLVGFAALAISFSSRGALSLAMPLWKLEFNWSRSLTSSIAASAMLVMAVVAPFAGNAVDRYGPRRLLAIGLLMVGTAMLLVASINSPSQFWLLVVGFGLIGGLGFGIVAQHVVATAIAARFVRNRGLATGIGTAGSTAGQVLVLPLLAATFAAGAWRWGFIGLGALSVSLCPLVLLMVRMQSNGAGQPDEAHPTASVAPQSLRRRIALMATNRSFHLLFWSYLICGFTTSGVIETHFLPFASLCGFGPVPGATAYGVLCAINLGGMITAGWLTDRIHRPTLLAAIYFARALCFVLLMFVDLSYPKLMLFAVLFGAFDYSTVPVTAGLLARNMGVNMLGLSMGVLSAAHAVGGALGAMIGGYLFDRLGNYDALWYTSIGLALAAAAMAALINDTSGTAHPFDASRNRSVKAATPS
ncbi:Sugar phosphate permease [Burkholderia sp. YR290]|jgi:MFS family permease|nr:Sugar phosphate permease [Burkholderia sp. YR290]